MSEAIQLKQENLHRLAGEIVRPSYDRSKVKVKQIDQINSPSASPGNFLVDGRDYPLSAKL